MFDNILFHSCFRGALKPGVVPVSGPPEQPVFRKVCLSSLLEVALVVKIFLYPSNPFECAAALTRISAINTDTQSLSRGRIQVFMSKKSRQAYKLFLPYITLLISLCCFFQVCSVYLSTTDFTQKNAR